MLMCCRITLAEETEKKKKKKGVTLIASHTAVYSLGN